VDGVRTRVRRACVEAFEGNIEAPSSSSGSSGSGSGGSAVTKASGGWFSSFLSFLSFGDVECSDGSGISPDVRSTERDLRSRESRKSSRDAGRRLDSSFSERRWGRRDRDGDGDRDGDRDARGHDRAEGEGAEGEGDDREGEGESDGSFGLSRRNSGAGNVAGRSRS
jgi:hypothetical protein